MLSFVFLLLSNLIFKEVTALLTLRKASFLEQIVSLILVYHRIHLVGLEELMLILLVGFSLNRDRLSPSGDLELEFEI